MTVWHILMHMMRTTAQMILAPRRQTPGPKRSRTLESLLCPPKKPPITFIGDIATLSVNGAALPADLFGNSVR